VSEQAVSARPARSHKRAVEILAGRDPVPRRLVAEPGLPRLTPLRGRDYELGSLREHLDQLRRGIGSSWLIEGGPGLGKSRMVEQAMFAARDAGFAVGHGVAEPDDTAVQLAVLMDALFGGHGPVLDRSALGDSHSSPEQRYWLFQDLQMLLEQAALRQPIMICLDDLQWADSGTTAGLRSLPPRLAALPIGWVIAYRPPEADSNMGRVAAELLRGGGIRTALDRLDRAAVAEVATDVLGTAPDAAVLALAESAHGNPFFLRELLSGLRDEGLVEVLAGRAVLIEPGLPRRVRESMHRRLGRMSPAARRAAAVAASMGRRFTIADLAAVLGTPASALLDPVEELIDSGLLTEGEDVLSFSHDVNREAVRASQPSSAVHALDRQVASALLAAGALPVEVATQLASSAAPGDDLAISTLMKASDALSGTDPGQAADVAGRALGLTAERHPLRGPLTARAAVLLHAAGRIDEAKAFADSALGEVLPAVQEAEVRLGIASMFAISPEVRAESCRRALALAGLPTDLRARLLALLLHNLVVAVRPHQAQQLLGEVKLAVEETGDSAARFTLQVAEAALDYIVDDFEAALTGIDASLSGSVYAGLDPREYQARAFRCWILATLDRHDEAMASATSGIQSAQQARQSRALQLFDSSRGRQLLQLGRLSDAAAALEGRFTPGDSHLVLSVLDADAVVALGRVALHTADQRLTVLTSAVAQVMVKSGVPGVERHAAERRQHSNPGAPSVLASAVHARGLLSGDPELLGRAVTILESGQRRLALASALEDLAGAEIRAGCTDEAIAALDRALLIHAACGAHWDLSRVRRRLRQLGIQRRLPAERRPAKGWTAMTDSELAICRLVADGLTNREVAERLYISPHTVSGHLRHAFEKLGVNSRVALTRMAAEHLQPA
jgi:DNA-binding CsgD family transcriptional regulator